MVYRKALDKAIHRAYTGTKTRDEVRIIKKEEQISKKEDKILKEEKKIEKEIKKIGKNISNTQGKIRVRDNGQMYLQNSMLSNSTYYDCLMYPRSSLSRIPGGTSRSLVVKTITTFSLPVNVLGNAAFIYMPQCINDNTTIATSTSNFFWQNAAAYNGKTPEIITGYIGQNITTSIPTGFSGARMVSANIRLTPNVSLTTATGQGIIALGKVKVNASSRLGPTDGGLVAVYSNLQDASNVLSSDSKAVCQVSRMQGIEGDWYPSESSDILNFPPINYTAGGALSSVHPNENCLYGIFQGIGNATTVNIEFVQNYELIPDMTVVGLFGLMSEYATEKVDPLATLRNASLTKAMNRNNAKHSCRILPYNGPGFE